MKHRTGGLPDWFSKNICITCSPNNFVGGATAPPVPVPMSEMGFYEELCTIFNLYSFYM